MVYNYRTGAIVPFVQKHYKLLIVAVATMFLASIASMTLSAGAVPVNVAGCDFDDDGTGTWSLQADCMTNGPINVPAGQTLEGNGYTINANYSFGSNPAGTNTVIGVVGADHVTLRNFTIDGTGGSSLHGINVYLSENLYIENVNVMNNDKSGLVVNGSEVTVSNFQTSGNGWHGINVDQGSGVTEPSILNIDGPTNQGDEFLDIYSDDTSADVTVNDTLSQYVVSENVFQEGDRVYTWSDVIVPVVDITSPMASDSPLSENVTVEGTIEDDNNARHRLLVRNSDGDVVYSQIVRDDTSPVANAMITFDSSMFPDGEYRLVLVGIDEAGNRGRDAVRVAFDNVVADKDGCKNGMWVNGVEDGDFRNQGDCVSYFATGGQNQPTDGARNERANRNR